MVAIVAVVLKLNPDACALEGYRIACRGPLQGGHLFHRGEVRGNAEARKILVAQAAQFMETGHAELMAWQCAEHNVGRYANSREAKRIQLLQKVYEYGWQHMAEFMEMFLSTFKVRPVEWELERMLS